MNPDPEVCGELLSPLRALLALKQVALHEFSTGSEPPYAASGLLGELVTGGEARAGDLAQHRIVDASVVSRQVAQLEQAGLLTRRPSPDDRRVSLLSATEKGRQAFAAMEHRKKEWLSHALRDWDTEQVRNLTEQLAAVSGDLRAAAEELVCGGDAHAPRGHARTGDHPRPGEHARTEGAE